MTMIKSSQQRPVLHREIMLSQEHTRRVLSKRQQRLSWGKIHFVSGKAILLGRLSCIHDLVFVNKLTFIRRGLCPGDKTVQCCHGVCCNQARAEDRLAKRCVEC